MLNSQKKKGDEKGKNDESRIGSSLPNEIQTNKIKKIFYSDLLRKQA